MLELLASREHTEATFLEAQRYYFLFIYLAVTLDGVALGALLSLQINHFSAVIVKPVSMAVVVSGVVLVLFWYGPTFFQIADLVSAMPQVHWRRRGTIVSAGSRQQATHEPVPSLRSTRTNTVGSQLDHQLDDDDEPSGTVSADTDDLGLVNLVRIPSIDTNNIEPLTRRSTASRIV